MNGTEPPATAGVTEEVRFRSGDGECAATLYRPNHPPRPHRDTVGCVVMGNGFSLTRRDGLPLFAEQFAKAGLAVLTFDFRHLGDSSGEPRPLVDPRRQRDDFSAAVAFARTLPGVDPDRIATWGFSLGGGIAVRAAADDGAIAAVVALCPILDGVAFAMSGRPLLAARLVSASARDHLGRRSVRVPVVGVPGSFAVLTQPEVLAGLDVVRGHGSRWRNEVCAGPLIRCVLFRPIGAIGKIRCPLLLCTGDQDRLAPQRPIVRATQRASHGTLRHYPIDHFGGFSIGSGFEQVAADHEEFLVRQLNA